MNTIIPGVGNLPFSSGDASFAIEESVMGTRDLQVKSPALRLRYIGTVITTGRLMPGCERKSSAMPGALPGAQLRFSSTHQGPR